MKIGGYRIRMKSYAGLFIPVLFTAVLIYYVVGSLHLIHSEATLIVKAITAVMLLSLAFIIKDELVIQKADDNISEEKKHFFPTREDYKKFMGFALLCILYIISLPYIGFTIATLVFLAITMFFLGIRNIRTLVLIPILLTGGIYVLFKVILMVSLPLGMLGI